MKFKVGDLVLCPIRHAEGLPYAGKIVKIYVINTSYIYDVRWHGLPCVSPRLCEYELCKDDYSDFQERIEERMK